MPTLAHALAVTADEQPHATAVRFRSDQGSWTALSYQDLWGRATALARSLSACRAGEHGQLFVLIALPSGPEYVVAFYACLVGGATAVTFYPPQLGTARAERAFDRRLGEILVDCDPSAVIGTDQVLARVAGRPDRLLLQPAALPGPAALEPPDDIAARPERSALLQYTSGSTTRPKGVLVSHANLVANVSGIAARLGSAAGESLTSWLPLFHDMGLIGALLHPLWAGMTVHLMPPTAFLRRPSRWLETVSETRSCITMAPDFAYALAARKAGQAAAGQPPLDLSSLRHAINAAEPIRPATIEAFQAAYGRYGLRPDVMTPGYGLAENTLCVAALDRKRDPVLVDVSADRFARSGLAVPATGGKVRRLVACGRDFAAGTHAVVVDPQRGRACPPGTVGEIWVAGSSVAQGYWRQPAETEATFRARLAGDSRRWLRTGDLGVFVDGVLCVIGRLKDVVIRNGVNLYFTDLEATAADSHPALSPGGGAALTVDGANGDEVVLVHELASFGPDVDRDQVISQIRRAVAEEHGLALDVVALLRRGAIPRTTSGKVQRSACARRWLAGELNPIALWSSHVPSPGGRT